MTIVHLFRRWLCALCFGILMAPAYAQLGSPASSHVAGTTTLRPPRHAIANGAAMVRTATDDGGTTVDEYTDRTGRVFAYGWQGPTMPDLRALLGSYLDGYQTGADAQAAAQPSTASLHAVRVDAGNVIVEAGGRMGAYVGRAWLPDALPAGVAAANLR